MITVTLIIALVLFFIIVGFAARQMQDLRENTAAMEEMDLKIYDLTRENEGLRRDKKDLSANLEMLLAERNKSA